MDERTHSRVLIHCPIAFQGDFIVSKGMIRDLSLSGCGVGSHTILRKGTQLTAQVSMPDQEEPMVIKLAEVCWALGGNFGLKFLKVGPKERKRLMHLLKDQGFKPSPA